MKKICGKDVLAVNVIDPVVDSLTAFDLSNKVGIIGTKRTVSTRAYTKRIRKRYNGQETAELATPLLAPMIEEGFFNNKISRTIIHSYLSKKTLEGIGTLILACTHYPLIQKEIEEYYRGQVGIIDSAEAVARSVANMLGKEGMKAETLSGKHEFYLSDYTESFEKTARIFFDTPIRLKEMNLWA